MADKLVKWLNERGYQPVYMPLNGINPPELYHYSKPRLSRVGPLRGYLPPGTHLPKNRTGDIPDIQIVQTSTKGITGAAKFLSGALQALGIAHAPAIDLSFAGSGDFIFRFVGVTYEEIDPAALATLVPKLLTDKVPAQILTSGQLYIAYHYAYAAKLEMRRADQKQFKGDVTGVQIENVVDIRAGGKVDVKDSDTLVFTATSKPAVFAYKVGPLEVGGGFFPGGIETSRFAQPAGDHASELLVPGVVLKVENYAAND